MAEGIGVAVTGGTSADGSRWVSYDCGEWDAVAQEGRIGGCWEVFLVPKDPARKMKPLTASLWLSPNNACSLAEAVAVAVGHVTAAGPAVEETTCD